MKTSLIYFTGTGNTFYCAKAIKNKLNDAELVPVAKLINRQEIRFNSDIIGLFFPVYFLDIPDIFKSFLKKFIPNKNQYIFAVATCNGVPGNSLYNVNKLLINKKFSLNAGFKIIMPGNNIVIVNFTNSIDEQKNRIQQTDIKLKEILDIIKNRKNISLNDNFNIKHYFIEISGKFLINFAIKAFYADQNCTLCGLCIKLCPKNNISIKSNKIVWGNKCEKCWGCLHLCPMKAIQVGKSTIGRIRYHHPEITLNDLIIQNN